jgi:hypothetical protein
METPTISERPWPTEAPLRTRESRAPRSLDVARGHAPLPMPHDTMRPFRDARGVGRVWCSLVAFPMF